VYGAAIAIPQISRSAGWPKSMCALTARAYLFVLLNYFAQTAFVYYIYDSQANMNPFGGQMHLCDFASHIDHCPNSPNCHGPGGEEIPDPGALYPFDVWNTRRFVRDSLVAMFPDRKDEITGNVDPGEYGLESNYCRWLCIFIFVLQIADEFQNITDLIKLLRRLPSAESHDAPWVNYDPPCKDVHGIAELDLVKFEVNGMPFRWKVFNTVFLLIPRIFIWRMLTMAGVHFLMETAAMVDQIVNTTALSFVLTTDELILERLATKAARHIMADITDYSLFDDSSLKSDTDHETLNRYMTEEMSWMGRHVFPLWPRRLFYTVALMAVFTAEYYFHNCEQMFDGSWVSMSVFLPEKAHLDLRTFLWKFFSLNAEPPGEPFWTMPEQA
jgi:hypothetical protein